MIRIYKMYYFLKVSLCFLLMTKAFSAELSFTCHGVDKFPVFDQIDDQNTFMTYTNEFQCTSNTSMITFGTANGIVESILTTYLLSALRVRKSSLHLQE